MAYAAQANPTSQQPKYQQQQQPQQTAPQQQASPFKAPDMSAYAQPSGGYNANVPRTPPKGARQNDLSGNVPSNQVWGQAYNQVAQQYGMPGATSYTMPGSYSSQSYSPTTGQYGPMSGGQSFDGNMAYNAVNNRPPPVSASAAGLGGNQMPWQDAMSQREAFVGNLSQRLGQYSGGQLTGPVTFDPGQLMQQANDQLANGTFYNPFSQQNAMQNSDLQRAMGNSSQYMQGNFDNPFGQQANVPQPSFGEQSYNPTPSPQSSQLAPGSAQPAQTSQEERDRIFRENYRNNPANWVHYDPATGMATHGLPAGEASLGSQPAALPAAAYQPERLAVPNVPPYSATSPVVSGGQIPFEGKHITPPDDGRRATLFNGGRVEGLAPPASPDRPPSANPNVMNAREGAYFDPSLGAGGQWVHPKLSPPVKAQPAGSAQPIPPAPQGTPYNPTRRQDPLPPVVDPLQAELDDKKRAAEYRQKHNITLPKTGPSPDYYRQYPDTRPPDRTNMIPFTDYDPRTGQRLNNFTPAQLADNRWSELQQKALNDLYDNGTDTPENIAGFKDHFRQLRAAGASPMPTFGQSDDMQDEAAAPAQRGSPVRYGKQRQGEASSAQPPKMSESQVQLAQGAGHKSRFRR